MNTDQTMNVADLNKANITIGNLLANIAGTFGIDPTTIKVDLQDIVDEQCNTNMNCGLVFIVNTHCADLGRNKFTSTDFDLFCKNNNLNGIIFFNLDNTVTFSMTVKGHE